MPEYWNKNVKKYRPPNVSEDQGEQIRIYWMEKLQDIDKIAKYAAIVITTSWPLGERSGSASLRTRRKRRAAPR